MAAQESKYKTGTFIQVTRKCSENIQPAIIDGGLYLVLEEYPATKSGARRLRVTPLKRAVQRAMVNPHAHIPMKETTLINADRFSWKVKSNTQLKREVEAYKAKYIKKQEQRQDKEIQAKFSDKERSQLAYTPYLYAELAWHYAHKAVGLCVERRVEELKKTTRTIKALRQDFISELRKKMPLPVIEAAQGKVQKALQEYALDFFKLELSMQNEINRHLLKTNNDDIKTYAFISMLCCEALRRVDINNARLIQKRLGSPTEVVESFRYMRELYESVQRCVGDKIPKSQIVDTSVKILEKNISKLTL